MVVPYLWRKKYFQSSHCNQNELLTDLGQPGLHLELIENDLNGEHEDLKEQ